MFKKNANNKISDIYLYEEGSNLTIPLEGRFLKIDYQDDCTTTVLDTGDQQVVLNRRLLQTCFDGAFDV